MAGKTFEELKTSLGNWLALNTSQFSDGAKGEMINLAQKEILRAADLTFGEYSTTFATVVGTSEYDVPEGFIQPHSLWYTNDDGDVEWLQYYNREDFDERYPPGSDNGDPAAYTLWGDKFVLGPPPDSIRTINVNCQRLLPDLEDGSPDNTNDLVENAWELVLFKALALSCIYVLEDSRGPIFQAKAAEMLNALIVEHSRSRSSGRRPVAEES